MPRLVAWWPALILAAAGPAWSQQPALDGRRGQATRQELQAALVLHEDAAASAVYSDLLRARARQEAGLIRERLERGDFQIGDRVQVSVEEQTGLTGIFTVTEGPALDFPAIREVSLAGVLNSELERHLRTAVGRFIDNPHLTAQPLTRVSIFGAVPQPGFYVTPPAMLLSDALMLAGGPTAGARVDHITIERVGQRIWSGDSLRLAMVEGRTLDQLDLRDGDRIKVPQPSRGLSVVQSALSWVSMLTSIPITVFTVTRLF